MHIFLSNYWWQESDIWSQPLYRYAILWKAFLDLSDSYFLFADLVGFYTHWTYMHIFRHIFLSNYWWQESDIWSQALYRYAILWEAFLDPSDSYFLFADLVGFYTHWTYMHIFRHIFLSNYWWQRADIWSQASWFLPSIGAEKNATKNEHICSMCRKIIKVGKQEVGIWWVQKCFPRYGVAIWSLWPKIRSLPSIVAEKNVTKNVSICSMFIYAHFSSHFSQQLLMTGIWYLVTSFI
jgi:hypothetical protein